MSAFIKFCGAARTVTGSCCWLRTDTVSFLVDCGMFHGPKRLKQLNYDDFPFIPGEIDFVLLTHAHIDHSGLVAKLIRKGFDGPVYATEGTRDLLSYMLPDSGYIQEQEVRYLNERNRRRGYPTVKPIYTRDDGVAALSAFRPVEYEDWIEPAPGVRARFWNAGHILGSASIELAIDAGEDRPVSMLFSGDIGPEHKLFHPDPEAPAGLDYVVCESTYGGRERDALDPAARRARFADEVNAALDDDGILLIPSFAVERSQELLADLFALMDAGAVPSVPVFLDSPLAIRATEVFAAHAAELEPDARARAAFDHPNLRFSETVEDSKAIARFASGAIILAASGMCDAGRIRHHLKRYLWRDNATVMLTGFQAPGTLGRLLEEGATSVNIFGEPVTVRARIRTIDLYSGHADGTELVEWIQARAPIRRKLFLAHGDAEAIDALRADLAAVDLDGDVIATPQLDDEFDLVEGAFRPREAVIRRMPVDGIDRPDWHNRLAALTLALRARLDAASDDAARERILAELRETLDQASGG